MTAGRPRTPIEKQALRAKGDGLTPGKRRVTPKGTSVVVQGRPGQVRAFDHRTLPKMPANLGKRGRVEWYKIWDNGPWLRPHEDFRWVEIMCRAYDDIDAFRAQVDMQGHMVPGQNGSEVANPLLKEIREAERQIMKCLSVLGFSPSDRARLGLAEIKTQSALADLQARAQQNRGG